MSNSFSYDVYAIGLSLPTNKCVASNCQSMFFGRLKRGELVLMGQLLSSNVTFLVELEELEVLLSCDISDFSSFDLDEDRIDEVFEEDLLDEFLVFIRQMSFCKVS
jgi:hypothetical protein